MTPGPQKHKLRSATRRLASARRGGSYHRNTNEFHDPYHLVAPPGGLNDGVHLKPVAIKSLPYRVPLIRVQSVLYNLPVENVVRTLEHLENAAIRFCTADRQERVVLALGDCSPQRSIQPSVIEDLRKRFPGLSGIEYNFFGANLGHGGGQNRLLREASDGLVMVMNPDVLVAPNLFAELTSALRRPGVAVAEARQLPIEHAKYSDPVTGESSWGSMACALASASLFHQLGGFDEETFFMYCDDVDFSWRTRLAGYKVVQQSSAVVFHDKKLGNSGGWQPTAAERYYSAEAGLLLPYKYSRPDLTNGYLEFFERSNDEMLIKAAEAFVLRRKSGRLPKPLDPEHLVGQFIDGNYAVHRFVSR